MSAGAKPVFERISYAPIGWIRTPFQERFGVPRQPGLAPSARGRIELKSHYFSQTDLKNSLKGLEAFTHLWVIFHFHDAGLDQEARTWKPSIRPPRLGGAKKVGVLGSRSPHRPNPIGLSVVRIEKILLDDPNGPTIEVSGVDLLDQTPVLDIKPYLAYCDSVADANDGWTPALSTPMTTRWTDAATADLTRLVKSEKRAATRQLIEEILALDPRPAFQRTDPPGADYGFTIAGLDVKWRSADEAFTITGIVPDTRHAPLD